MALPLLPLLGLVPEVVGMFTDDEDVTRAAETASNVARTLTGADDESAVDALKADPALLMEFQTRMRQFAMQEMQEQTKRLRQINRTMRTEYESANTYKTGWRPAVGWVLAFSFLIIVLAVVVPWVWFTFDDPSQVSPMLESAARLIGALNNPIIAMAAVLGVLIKKRSDDKHAAIDAPDKGGTLGKLYQQYFGGRR
ncbi:3TM-type holin [Desulfovibrio oxyclinae]|uniref:3TM-type holin n=1 Tax=Desulfovibrio oxyclinae TaxID=63560 RepID=UPI00037792CF|nr:3TM-type holin [Desulfovibrio oxyclinae]